MQNGLTGLDAWCGGLPLAQHQAPTRVTHSNSPATAGQQREKKSMRGSHVEIRSRIKHFKGKTGST